MEIGLDYDKNTCKQSQKFESQKSVQLTSSYLVAIPSVYLPSEKPIRFVEIDGNPCVEASNHFGTEPCHTPSSDSFVTFWL
jgi:hypothetical protein